MDLLIFNTSAYYCGHVLEQGLLPDIRQKMISCFSWKEHQHAIHATLSLTCALVWYVCMCIHCTRKLASK